MTTSKEETTSITSEWEKLATFPFQYFPKPLSLNSSSFVVVPQRYSACKGDGIYTYHIDRDEWEKIIPYQSKLETSSHSAALDINNNVVYIYGDENNLYRFDLSAKKQLPTIPVRQPFGSHPRMEFINDSLHLIGGDGSNKHHICGNA